MKFNFISNEEYSRKEVKAIINHPEPDSVGGIWGTGYAPFEDAYFLFANLGMAGRTGHNYSNVLTQNSLYWFSKGTSSIHTPSMVKMMSGDNEVYIFTREDSGNVKFKFQGLGYVKDFEDAKPAHIVWGLTRSLSDIPRGFESEKRKRFIEGARTEATTTRYERNPLARKACLDYYGYNCLVCEMDFEQQYGEIGQKFIHVHHEIEISAIGEEYEIDPINDLKPVCPNCHAMLHKSRPAFTIEELKVIMRLQKN
ncbi:HNH endonuclease [Planococcus halocryophilus]|uniref:HNH endonuclease n=1 Tax=Planococcus halocryophilus TaxID=1215089 RepID=UPI001F0F267D|nr:DUF3427 domain-containing protein [Planococcus halocryophilus]MCH4826645.1 DUF3427 domain-containing protein [Planococcus halocryophilus]